MIKRCCIYEALCTFADNLEIASENRDLITVSIKIQSSFNDL